MDRIRRQASRFHLRKWRLAWAALLCAAGIVIGSNTLSQFASSLVHGVHQSPAMVTAPSDRSSYRNHQPSSPPTRVCDDRSVLSGESSPPAHAIVVPAGDDSGVNFGLARATYWFTSGEHRLGPGMYTQIIPGDGATFTGAPGAVLDGAHANDYAFSGDATHVTIRYLTVENFGGWGDNQNQGVVNHNSAPYWTIDHVTIRNNAGAGVMLGSHDTLDHDCLADNQQYGFNAYTASGVSGLVITHSEISGNDTYNWESHDSGCGCTGGGKFWDTDGAVITDNYIHGNHGAGLWADTDNRGFEVSGNYISGNYSYGFIYEISYNADITWNTFARNGLGEGPRNPGFPASAIYISESGGDSRVPGPSSGHLTISHNTFSDNWSGVILWENSDRFCGSPANTSTGYCTLVNPAQSTLRSCGSADDVEKTPYYDDCRWKTRNVSVDHNVFDFAPTAVGASCQPTTGCGFQGLFSEYGTYPSWSPYHGTTVERHITLGQNNHFSDNVYNGPWQFMVMQQGTIVNWQVWNGGPYRQDHGSVLNGVKG